MSHHEKELSGIIEYNELTKIQHQIPVYVIMGVDFEREPWAPSWWIRELTHGVEKKAENW